MYMAPEQVEAEAIDGRADLFSLGSVLYTMCTGRPPFRAPTSMAVLKRVSEDTPRSIREIIPEVPKWLCEIIDKLHAKNPDERFQSAKEVADLLGRCLIDVEQDKEIVIEPQVNPPHSSQAATQSPPKSHVSQQADGKNKLNRRRVAALVATVALLLVSGFAITEAAGVTRIAATVIRIAMGEGTLVVEVDDPTIVISIDGEELRIAGAGLQELKLRPGQYKFQATKNGQPIEQKLVSISRGDREVVRITREGPDAATTKSGVRSGAFVLLDSQGKQAGKYNTLEEAVLGSSPGDTIEIRGNGPFETQGVYIRHPLTIRAGMGFQPRIHQTERNPYLENNCLLQNDSLLVLEGLEMRTFVEDGNIINAVADIRMLNCRLYDPRGAGFSCLQVHKNKNADLKNCLAIQTGLGGSIGGEFGTDSRIANSVLVGILTVDRSPSMAPSLEIAQSTLVTAGIRLVIRQEPAKDASSVKVHLARNLLVAPIVVNLTDHAISDKVDYVLGVFKQSFGWTENSNLYQQGSRFLRLNSPDNKDRGFGTHSDLSTFKQFWNQQESNSTVGQVRFRGGDLISRFRSRDGSISVEDFRLREDSAGYQAGPDGKDIAPTLILLVPVKLTNAGNRLENTKSGCSNHAN